MFCKYLLRCVHFNNTLNDTNDIKSETYFIQHTKIKSIGGDSVQKMVSNIFTNCITFNVGHKLSWTGAKNTIAIENSTFANIIIGKLYFYNELFVCSNFFEYYFFLCKYT